VSHGTLLLRSNLDDVSRALRPKPGKVESKGIQSIRSRVTNIGDYLSPSITMEDFRAALLAHLFPGAATPPALELDADDWARVRELADTKYRTWEWNYGESPPFNLQRVQRFPIGEVDARLQVEDGFVKHAKFHGDFFARGDIGDLETALTGVRYRRDDLLQAMQSAHADEILDGVGLDDLVRLLY